VGEAGDRDQSSSGVPRPGPGTTTPADNATPLTRPIRGKNLCNFTETALAGANTANGRQLAA